MRVNTIIVTLFLAASCYAQVDMQQVRADIDETTRRIAELKPITGIAHDKHCNILGPQFDCKSLLPWVSRHKQRLKIDGQVLINLRRGDPEIVALRGDTYGGKDRLWITGRTDQESKELILQGLEYIAGKSTKPKKPAKKANVIVAMLAERGK